LALWIACFAALAQQHIRNIAHLLGKIEEVILENFLAACSMFFSYQVFLIMLFGLAIGVFIGAVPGLGPTMVIAIMIPFTYKLSPLLSIIFLTTLYIGGVYGGSITAILIRTPGTAAAVVTTLDGYEMSKQGKAGRALNWALWSSVFGNTMSALILLTAAPVIAVWAIEIGAVEYTTIIFMSLSLIVVVSGKEMVKGIIAGSLGLLIGTIGLDPIDATSRFSFGLVNMQKPINIIPVMIGIFAIAEIMMQLERKNGRKEGPQNLFVDTGDPRDKTVYLRDLWKAKTNFLRSAVIGTGVGALPGTGAVTSCFIAYGAAKKASSSPETFGKGNEEGVIASEAANNAVCGAALIPLLTLGIPGDIPTAVLLGAFILHGLDPGPLLFAKHGPLVNAVMLSVLVCGFFMFFVGKAAVKLFVKITEFPRTILFSIILILSMIGSYACNNSLFDVKVMGVFGALGYLMHKISMPVAPLLIGMILGPLLENSLRQSLILSGGSFLIFIQRPIALAIIIISLTFLLLILRKSFFGKRNSKNS